ncbi:Blumeria specific protein [Blumeria hordei DH14]|uniref:Blumeria specific protein n=1 Tax=Blumeria graminis f. sp. hordei (strain DH14) TaxID=546991 RepID=N1J5C1_BLUG1|nr:Blumeria specific protein [Blumeria hordei DH14]
MHAAVQDQITDSLGADSLASSSGGLDAITGFLKKRLFIEKKRIMMYDCMNANNQVESALFSRANTALIHACFAIGQIKNSTIGAATPTIVSVAKFNSPPPYYAWNIENKSPKHKKKGSKKSKNKREEAEEKVEEKVQEKFVIASEDCKMLGVVTRDTRDNLLYPCEKQWHVEL